MENKNSSYSVQIGKTTFIVCVKQSETAKKPIEKVFKDICRHEVQEDFFSAGLLSLEKLKKSSWQIRSRRYGIQSQNKVRKVLQPAGTDGNVQRGGGH